MAPLRRAHAWALLQLACVAFVVAAATAASILDRVVPSAAAAKRRADERSRPEPRTLLMDTEEAHYWATLPDELQRARATEDVPCIGVGHTDGGPMGHANARRCAFEPMVRVSDSHLWRLMTEYFAGAGSMAWTNETVPSFVTSNAFVAHNYARHVRAYIRDMVAKGQVSPLEPVYVVELGAGLGKFSYFMLQELEAMRPVAGFDARQIRYVMSDFSWGTVRKWRRVEQLKPYLESGALDYAVFDAVKDDRVHLIHGNVTLAPGAVANPMVVIANYVFDTLPHDAFAVLNGTLHEVLVSSGSRDADEPSAFNADIIKRMANDWLHRPVRASHGDPGPHDGGAVVHPRETASTVSGATAGVGSYGDTALRGTAPPVQYYVGSTASGTSDVGGSGAAEPDSAPRFPAPRPMDAAARNRVLEAYRELFGGHLKGQALDYAVDVELDSDQCAADAGIVGVQHVPMTSGRADYASLLMPVGAFRVIDTLQALTGGALAVVAGDKGYGSADLFWGYRVPAIAIHGSFSVMVNFHAIAAWVNARGGHALVTHSNDASLHCTVFVLDRPRVMQVSPWQPGANSRETAHLPVPAVESPDGHPTPAVAASAAAAAARAAADSAAQRAVVAPPMAFGTPPAFDVDAYPHLSESFEDWGRQVGPNEFFQVFQAVARDDAVDPHLRALLAMLRMSGFDPEVFWRFRGSLLSACSDEGITDKEKADISTAVERVLDRYYPMGLHKDVPFEVGRMAYLVDRPLLAMRAFFMSIDMFGSHQATLFNMGVTAHSLGLYTEALQYFRQTLDVAPHFVQAKEWIRKVEAEQALGAQHAVGSSAAEGG